MEPCKYKGQGCGKEDTCTCSEEEAVTGCKLRPYMETLDAFWETLSEEKKLSLI